MALSTERKVQIPEDLHVPPDGTVHVYSLTKKYEQFWDDFYENHCQGSQIKIPNKDLTKEDLLCLGNTIKNCYENERFLPSKLAQPLLEACIFNHDGENLVYVSQKMFMNFIEPLEKTLLSSSGADNSLKLKIVKKYCPDILDDIETDSDDSDESDGEDDNSRTVVVDEKLLKKAARIIMYKNCDRVIHIWKEIIMNIVSLEEFRFLMKNTSYNMPESGEIESDLIKFKELLPHRQWKTFFYRWPKAKINFYRDIISGDYGWPSEPYFCCRCNSEVYTKHILGSTKENCCTSTFKTLGQERYECVLRVIEKQIDKAISKSRGFFSGTRPDDWMKMIMERNMRKYKWRRELTHLRSDNTPHILVYNMKPKKALMVEFRISWEYNFVTSPKKGNFLTIIDAFECDGFEVRFDDLQMGSRGIVGKDTYNMFTQGFGFSHGKASKAMEKISKTIIGCSFNELNINFKKL